MYDCLHCLHGVWNCLVESTPFPSYLLETLVAPRRRTVLRLPHEGTYTLTGNHILDCRMFADSQMLQQTPRWFINPQRRCTYKTIDCHLLSHLRNTIAVSASPTGNPNAINDEIEPFEEAAKSKLAEFKETWLASEATKEVVMGKKQSYTGSCRNPTSSSIALRLCV